MRRRRGAAVDPPTYHIITFAHHYPSNEGTAIVKESIFGRGYFSIDSGLTWAQDQRTTYRVWKDSSGCTDWGSYVQTWELSDFMPTSRGSDVYRTVDTTAVVSYRNPSVNDQYDPDSAPDAVRHGLRTRACITFRC